MRLGDMKTGTRLDLVITGETEEKTRPSLVSEFEWAEGDKLAYIAAPILEGVIYPIRIGAGIEAYFIENLELYVLKANVLSRGVKDNISLLKIRIDGEFERIQRRQYYRFECSVPVKMRECSDREKDVNEENNNAYKKSLTRDLSGGGLCILAADKYEAGTILEIELKLDETEVLRFTGKVVRVSLSDINENYRYEMGICYKKIENKEREAVIRYIFNEQRKLRQKGLI